MQWDTTITGQSHGAIQDELKAQIARAQAVRELLDKIPASEPMQLNIAADARGGFSFSYRPVGDGRTSAVYAAALDRIARFLLKKCHICGGPRPFGSRFCSAECHTEWRVQDAARRGYPTD